MCSGDPGTYPDPPSALGLPELPAHFVGRDELARSLETKLQQCRLVTIVGAGGLGKTTLAVAVARRLAPDQADGVCFVDLSSLSPGDEPADRLAIALGLEVSRRRSAEYLREFLRPRRMLIVLDCCEAAIDAAAGIADDILSNAPSVLLLATSREPLQSEGEWVHRLAPLGWPPAEPAFPAWLAMTYPAVQLFFRIAQLRHANLAPNQPNVDLVAALCRRLEGSPLAIALAGSHVARLGLEGVASQVDGSMLTLAAVDEVPGRHRTLEAVLSWSHRLLGQAEQRVFRSLALFRGSFDLAAAVEVAEAGTPAPRAETSSAVLDLVEKSLLQTVHVGGDVLYRMADTTRVFAEAQLAGVGGEACRGARLRHARYLVRLLALAEQRWDSMDRVGWRRQHGAWIDDVRQALRWAFSTDGDRLTAVELTVRAFGLAEQTALFPDYRDFIVRALDEVPQLVPARPDLELRLRTFPALGQLRAISEDPRQLATLVETVEIARASGSAAGLLGSMLAVFAQRFQLGDYPAALVWSMKMQRVADAHADPVVDLTARRTRAQALHFLGEHAAARTLAQAICEQSNPSIPLAYTPSPVSTDVSMRILLARILWLEGSAEKALRLVDECLALAEQDAAQSLCQALAVAAIPIGLWCGHIDACRAWLDRLAELADRHDYPYWQTWTAMYSVHLGRLDGAAREAALQAMSQVRQTKYRDHITTFDDQAETHGGCARVEAGTVGWCAPELLRVRAERLMAAGRLDEAAVFLARSLDLARAQGALAWELRAAMTAMRLSGRTGAPAHGRDVLASVYGRFTEGFSTADLRAARRMLTEGPRRA